MILVFFVIFFLVPVMTAAEKQAAQLLIGANIYIDSERWMKYALDNRDTFQDYVISLEDKPLIQKALEPIINNTDNNNLKQYSETILMNGFIKCIQTRPADMGDTILKKEILHCSEKSKVFIAELCAIQFYKFVTFFQLLVGEHIQTYYEQRAPSPLFREHKKDALSDNLFNEVFYKGVFSKALSCFDDSCNAERIVTITEQFDIEIQQLLYNSSYNGVMIGLFNQYLHSLNELFEKKARL